jgi:putative iron-dependent peroxidase
MHPQDVTAKPGDYALFMVFSLVRGTKAVQTTQSLLGELPAIIRSMRGRFPAGQISCVTGIGSKAWDRLFPGRDSPKS